MKSDNRLMSDWRLRVFNANGLNFSAPTRLHFFDAALKTDKEVFADIASETSLGAYVDLDSSGYVPVSGVWLASGAYSCRVETYSYTDEYGVDVYNPLWTIPYITGGDADSSGADAVTIFDTVSDMRAFEPDGTNAMCLGYYDVGDMLISGAVYKWDTDSFDTDDEGSIIKPTSYSVTDAGRWVRIFEESPTIRDFGAVPGQANVKIRILNAQAYCSSVYSLDSVLTLRFPGGQYQLADEDLEINKNSIIEEYCQFYSTGTITLNQCTVLNRSFLAENIEINSYNPINDLRPEWWNDYVNPFTNVQTSLLKAYEAAKNAETNVLLSQSVRFGSYDVNIDNAVNTTVAEGVTITSDNTGVFKFGLGQVTTEAKEWLSGSLLGYVPACDLRVSWLPFASASWNFATKIYNALAMSNLNLIIDRDLTLKAALTDLGAGFVFENGAKLTITSSGSLSINRSKFNIEDFADVDTIGRVLSPFTLSSKSGSTPYPIGSLVFNTDVTIDGLNATVANSVGITCSGALAILNSAFIGVYSNYFVMNIVADTFLTLNTEYNQTTLVLATTTTGDLSSHDVHYCRFTGDSYLNYPHIEIVSQKIDALCLGLSITNNYFMTSTNVTSGVIGTGTWKNTTSDVSDFTAYRDHHVTIKDNICILNTGRTDGIVTEYRGAGEEDMYDTGESSWWRDNMIEPSPVSSSPLTVESDRLFVLYGNTEAVVDITFGTSMCQQITDDELTILRVVPVSLYSAAGRANAQVINPNIRWIDLSGIPTSQSWSVWRNGIKQYNDFWKVKLQYTYTLKIYGE